MDIRVASRYARALFLAAKKEQILDSVNDDLNGIAGAFERDPAFGRFMVDPNVARSDRLALLEKVFSDRVTALTMHLLRLLVEKRREDLFPAIHTEFQHLRREHENVLQVEITTSEPITETHQKAIIDKISVATGKKVTAICTLDPAVMAGVKVSFGDYVMDGTVKGALARLKESLIYDLLKQN